MKSVVPSTSFGSLVVDLFISHIHDHWMRLIFNDVCDVLVVRIRSGNSQTISLLSCLVFGVILMRIVSPILFPLLFPLLFLWVLLSLIVRFRLLSSMFALIWEIEGVLGNSLTIWILCYIVWLSIGHVSCWKGLNLIPVWGLQLVLVETRWTLLFILNARSEFLWASKIDEKPERYGKNAHDQRNNAHDYHFHVVGRVQLLTHILEAQLNEDAVKWVEGLLRFWNLHEETQVALNSLRPLQIESIDKWYYLEIIREDSD